MYTIYFIVYGEYGDGRDIECITTLNRSDVVRIVNNLEKRDDCDLESIWYGSEDVTAVFINRNDGRDEI